MKVLVYIETKEGAPVQGSLELLTAAKELGETCAVAIEDKEAAKKAAVLGDQIIPRVSVEEGCYTIALCDTEGKPYAVVWLRTGR